MLYGFIFYSIAGCILSGLSLALFSPFVMLKRISYLGEALSHIAFAGIAIALVLGWHLQVTTLVFVVGVAALIGFISRYLHVDESNTITIFLSVAMALGVVLIALKRSYTFDLSSYLFGNVLLVNRYDIIALSLLTLLNLGFILLCYRQLFYLTYNAEIARVYRIPVQRVYYAMMILLAMTIVTNVKIAGIILVTAQLILPAVIALHLTRRLPRAIVLCCLIALISAICGFVLSWHLNAPTGGVIVLFEFVLLIFVLLIRRGFGRV